MTYNNAKNTKDGGIQKPKSSERIEISNQCAIHKYIFWNISFML